MELTEGNKKNNFLFYNSPNYDKYKGYNLSCKGDNIMPSELVYENEKFYFSSDFSFVFRLSIYFDYFLFRRFYNLNLFNSFSDLEHESEKRKRYNKSVAKKNCYGIMVSD